MAFFFSSCEFSKKTAVFSKCTDVVVFYFFRIEEEELDKYNIPAKVESEKYKVIRTFSFLKSRMSSTRNKTKVNLQRASSATPVRQKKKKKNHKRNWKLFETLAAGQADYFIYCLYAWRCFFWY